MDAGAQLLDGFQRGRHRGEFESCLAVEFARRQIHFSLFLFEGVDLVVCGKQVQKIPRGLALSLSLRGKALRYTRRREKRRIILKPSNLKMAICGTKI